MDIAEVESKKYEEFVQDVRWAMDNQVATYVTFDSETAQQIKNQSREERQVSITELKKDEGIKGFVELTKEEKQHIAKQYKGKVPSFKRLPQEEVSKMRYFKRKSYERKEKKYKKRLKKDYEESSLISGIVNQHEYREEYALMCSKLEKVESTPEDINLALAKQTVKIDKLVDGHKSNISRYGEIDQVITATEEDGKLLRDISKCGRRVLETAPDDNKINKQLIRNCYDQYLQNSSTYKQMNDYMRFLRAEDVEEKEPATAAGMYSVKLNHFMQKQYLPADFAVIRMTNTDAVCNMLDIGTNEDLQMALDRAIADETMITDRGFISTSIKNIGFGGNIEFRILAKKGTAGTFSGNVAPTVSENELTLAPDTKFKVLSYDMPKKDTDKTIIYMETIPQHDMKGERR